MTGEPSPPRTLRSALPWLITICLFAFAAQGYHFAKLKGLTWDESIYLATGHQALVESEFAFNPEHPALIKQLLAIPNAFAEVRDSDHLENAGLDQFGYGAAFVATVPVDPQGFILRGRMANLALGLVLIATLAWWARRMWGVPAGLLALVLGVTEPNFIAHASFAAFDIAAALGVVLPAYALWELLQRPRRSWLIAFGLAIGFGSFVLRLTRLLKEVGQAGTDPKPPEER